MSKTQNIDGAGMLPFSMRAVQSADLWTVVRMFEWTPPGSFGFEFWESASDAAFNRRRSPAGIHLQTSVHLHEDEA